jgi:hypothetical protein
MNSPVIAVAKPVTVPQSAPRPRNVIPNLVDELERCLEDQVYSDDEPSQLMQHLPVASPERKANSRKRHHAAAWDLDFGDEGDGDQDMDGVESSEINFLVKHLHVKEPRSEHMPYIS